MSNTPLALRLLSVQTELKAPKNQRNKFGGYNYRSCEDILEAVKPLLAKHGLALYLTDEIVHFPSQHPSHTEQLPGQKGPTTELVDGDRFYVKATATVLVPETGETLSATAYARESHTKKGMDDAQVTGSASSYARKYALNGLFLIDDTKDPDTNEHQSQREGHQKAASGAKPQPKASTPPPAEPARTEPSGASDEWTEQQWQKAANALHAEASNHDIDHAQVKAWLMAAAVKKGRWITSTKDVSPAALAFLTARIRKDASVVKKEIEEALNNPDIYDVVYPESDRQAQELGQELTEAPF